MGGFDYGYLFSPVAPGGVTPVVIDLTGITPPSDATIVGSGYTTSTREVSDRRIWVNAHD